MPPDLAAHGDAFLLRCGGLWLVEVSPTAEMLASFRTALPLNNALAVALVIAAWAAMTTCFQCAWVHAQAREERLNESLQETVERLTARFAAGAFCSMPAAAAGSLCCCCCPPRG